MHIADFIAPADVIADLRCLDKQHVIATLARVLSGGLGIAEAAVAEALRAREALGSTGIGRGVAIPHAGIADARQVRGVFARLARPVDYGAVDQCPVDFVCAVVGPESGERHGVAALAAIVRLLRQDAMVARLRQVPDGAALYAALIDDAGVDRPAP